MKLKLFILNLLGLGVITLAVLFFGAVYAETFVDDTQEEFNSGSYSNTAWDVNHVELFEGQTSGTFTSGVFDAGGAASWSQLEWSENLVSIDKLIAVDGAADVWKSTDSGVTWTLIKDDYNESDGNNVDDMAVDSAGNIFILNNQDVWQSADSGISWTKINDDYNGSEGQNGLRIAVDSSNNVYISESDEDIWMSVDSGASWTKQAENINGSSDNILGFTAVGLFLYVIDAEADVWKSTDSGVTWTLLKDDYNGTDGNGSIDYMSHDATGNLYILHNQNIWKSSDSGISWTKINDDYNGSEGQNGLRIAVDSSNNVYISESDEDIWMSVDSGLNWTKQSENINGGNGNIFGMVYVSVSTDITFAVRSGNDNPPTDAFSGSFSNPEGESPGVLNGRYFQYQTTLTSDDGSVTPEFSNVTITYSLLDVTAPSAVADLSVATPSDSEIFVSWSAPGDDGSAGTATSYDLRYSASDITEENWQSANQIEGEPVPSVSGSLESKTVSGLLPNTTYYFAIKTSDEVPNESGLSNVASATTEKRDIYISADSNSKIYGDSDLELTYVVTSGSLAEGDSFTGELSRDAGENTGNYNILQGTLSAGEDYNIIFTGANFAINKRPVTVAAITDSKIYDRSVSSSKVPIVTSGSLAAGDTATWAQSFDTADAGTGKTLTPSGSVSDGNGGNNYEITFIDNTTGIITSPPNPQPSGGGGGGAPPKPSLVVFNESIESPKIDEESVTLTWSTNFASSSQIIYSAEGEPHSLDMADNKGSPPKYGYARTTPNYDEDKEVTFHSVVISGLTPDTTYYFRAVSHGSLAISWEYIIKTKPIEPGTPVIQAEGTEAVATGDSQEDGAGENNFLDNSNSFAITEDEIKEEVNSNKNTQVVLTEKGEEAAASLDNPPPPSQNIILASFFSTLKIDDIKAWVLNNPVLIVILTVAVSLICFLGIMIYRKPKK